MRPSVSQCEPASGGARSRGGGTRPEFVGSRLVSALGAFGMGCALSNGVNKLQPTNNDTLQAQADALTAQAKKHVDAGRELQGLALLRKAAELLPGAPWLQHRTAELARKLNRYDVAAVYFRRAGAAFIAAGFSKRAIAPLQSAWLLAYHLLPNEVPTFVGITRDLADLRESLGLSADAALTITQANEALKDKQCSEVIQARGAQRASGIKGLDPAAATPLRASG